MIIDLIVNIFLDIMTVVFLLGAPFLCHCDAEQAQGQAVEVSRGTLGRALCGHLRE